MDLISDGQHQYRLIKPHSTKPTNHMISLNIELSSRILWQLPLSLDRLITRSSSSKQQQQQQQQTLSPLVYPWLRYHDVVGSPLSPNIENKEAPLAHGDHLTFYLHNLVSRR
jgi:hypothetical protein